MVAPFLWRNLAGSSLNFVLFQVLLCLVVLKGLAVAPAFVLWTVPLATVALAAALLCVVVSHKPTELTTLPRWMTVVTLLRFLADLCGNGVGVYSELPQLEGPAHPLGLYLLLYPSLFLTLFAIWASFQQADRLQHVGERFLLDGLPGIKMALEAEVSMGILSAEQVRHREKSLAKLLGFFEFMSRSATSSRVDGTVSILILALTCWQAPLLWQADRLGMLHLLLVQAVGASLCALLLQHTLATSLGKAWDEANLGTECFIEEDLDARELRWRRQLIILIGLYLALNLPALAWLAILGSLLGAVGIGLRKEDDDDGE